MSNYVKPTMICRALAAETRQAVGLPCGQRGFAAR
jgi:hypothetical protein